MLAGRGEGAPEASSRRAGGGRAEAVAVAEVKAGRGLRDSSPRKRMDLYRVIRETNLATRRVMVGVSGKDSLVTLDLCRRFIPEVSGFFMYLVPGLGWQERWLRYVENRWRLKIVRLPHWQLAGMMRSGSFRPPNDQTVRLQVLGQKDIEEFLRIEHGATWFAYGIRRSDGFTRRSLLGRPGALVDAKRRRTHPVADFSTAQIYAYIRQKNILLPPEYADLKHSFFNLNAPDLQWVHDHHPDDYEKILSFFPHAEASLARVRFATEPVPVVPNSGSPPQPDQDRGLQPAADQ